MSLHCLDQIGIFWCSMLSFRSRSNWYHHMCHGQKSRFVGDDHPTLSRNPYNGYINPYYWVDDHPLLLEFRELYSGLSGALRRPWKSLESSHRPEQ